MTELEDLKTARARATTRLSEVLANPKPNYSIDGETVQWSAYANMLRASIKELNQMIAGRENRWRQMQGYT